MYSNSHRNLHTFVNLAANETATAINFNEKLISNLIVALNSNKAYGSDALSIRILEMDSYSTL